MGYGWPRTISIHYTVNYFLLRFISRFKKILSQYFRKASGIIIFFDGSKEDGIEQAERWASLVNEECDDHATIILVANKIDLGQGIFRQYHFTETKSLIISAIPDENGIMLADKYDGHYLKNSSKTGDGIFRIMKLLSRSLAQNSKSNDEIDERTVKLEVSKRQSCCRSN